MECIHLIALGFMLSAVYMGAYNHGWYGRSLHTQAKAEEWMLENCLNFQINNTQWNWGLDNDTLQAYQSTYRG